MMNVEEVGKHVKSELDRLRPINSIHDPHFTYRPSLSWEPDNRVWLLELYWEEDGELDASLVLGAEGLCGDDTAEMKSLITDLVDQALEDLEV